MAEKRPIPSLLPCEINFLKVYGSRYFDFFLSLKCTSAVIPANAGIHKRINLNAAQQHSGRSAWIAASALKSHRAKPGMMRDHFP
jgi:hypothetical protein